MPILTHSASRHIPISVLIPCPMQAVGEVSVLFGFQQRHPTPDGVNPLPPPMQPAYQVGARAGVWLCRLAGAQRSMH